jgi:hypothetical protein
MDDIQYQRAFHDFASGVDSDPIVVQGDEKLIGVLQKPGTR